MIEKIYDTIKGILYTDFPKNSKGIPAVYDREIEEWFFGDRQILPSPLGVVLRGTTSSIKDIGYGLLEIEYTIGLTFYSSNDDKETSERVIQEAARLAQSSLKNHRSMWICELCPFCGAFPLSPIHYVDNGVVSSVGIATATMPANSDSYIVYIPATGAGFTSSAVVRISPSISGQATVAEILSCGMGIQTTRFVDSYVDLNLVLSDGSGHTGYSTIFMQNYLQTVSNNTNTYWSETHSTSAPPYLDWAGASYNAVQMMLSDWGAGIKPVAISANTTWNTNLNNVSNNNVNLARYLVDIRISGIEPSDDGMSASFLHSAKFTLSGKEIISVDRFGPNSVNINAV